MKASYVGENCITEVVYRQANYGAIGWTGNSVSVNSANQPCSDFTTTLVTHNCNTTNQKAFGATIYLNTYYGSYTNPSFEMRHELGHVFGMAHVYSCSIGTVMHPYAGYCAYTPSTLQYNDLVLIDSWY